MKLSTKGQHAIKAMMELAIYYNNKPVTLTELSEYYNISVSYLEQLFSILRSSGIVQGVRGPGGGYRLAKTPSQISLADIIFSIEESSNNTSVKKRMKRHNVEKCLANDLWNQLSAQLTAYLSEISLADIIKDQVVVKPQYNLDETTRRISNMFPVSAHLKVA